MGNPDQRLARTHRLLWPEASARGRRYRYPTCSFWVARQERSDGRGLPMARSVSEGKSNCSDGRSQRLELRPRHALHSLTLVQGRATQTWTIAILWLGHPRFSVARVAGPISRRIRGHRRTDHESQVIGLNFNPGKDLVRHPQQFHQPVDPLADLFRRRVLRLAE